MRKQKWTLFKVDGITMKIKRSDVEYLCISIMPPYGEVHIKAPNLISVDKMQNIIESKLEWIIDQQQSIQLSVDKGNWIKSIYIHMENIDSSIYITKL